MLSLVQSWSKAEKQHMSNQSANHLNIFPRQQALFQTEKRMAFYWNLWAKETQIKFKLSHSSSLSLKIYHKTLRWSITLNHPWMNFRYLHIKLSKTWIQNILTLKLLKINQIMRALKSKDLPCLSWALRAASPLWWRSATIKELGK